MVGEKPTDVVLLSSRALGSKCLCLSPLVCAALNYGGEAFFLQ